MIGFIVGVVVWGVATSIVLAMVVVRDVWGHYRAAPPVDLGPKARAERARIAGWKDIN